MRDIDSLFLRYFGAARPFLAEIPLPCATVLLLLKTSQQRGKSKSRKMP